MTTTWKSRAVPERLKRLLVVPIEDRWVLRVSKFNFIMKIVFHCYYKIKYLYWLVNQEIFIGIASQQLNSINGTLDGEMI